MPINIFKSLTYLVCVIFLSGCGVQAKRYVEVRDRVDRDIHGNAGYLSGTPSADEKKTVQKTRKMYVLEVSKEGKQVEEVTPPPPPPQRTTRRRQRQAPPRERVVIPSFDESQESSAPTGFAEYTVQKNDTLQKISKQFYDGYSKWPRIYEANKEKIKDPNRIKPGITLRIPLE